MEHLVLFPVDTVKVSNIRLIKMINEIFVKQTHLQSSQNDLKFGTIAKILYREEGLIRFWKGANVLASGVIPAHAGMFTIYEVLKEKFKYQNDSYQIFTTMGIGAASTFAHDFFITPCDVIK